jgi:hypothetical protein
MTLKDFLLSPIYLSLLYLIAINFRNRYTNKATRRYFLRALHFKFFGAFALGVIYYYYYGGGDTTLFFDLAGTINRSASKSIWTTFKIIFGPMMNDPETFPYLHSNIFWVKRDGSTFFVIRLVSLASILSFHTYTINAFFFASFSFVGSWALFMVFQDKYPQLTRQMAIAVLFVPSVVFWGSGLMKDSITFGALGMLFHGFYFGLIKRTNLIRNAVMAAVGVFFLASIKVYILNAALPSLLVWLYLHYNSAIKVSALRILIAPILLLITVGVGTFGMQRLTENTEYSLERMAIRTQITYSYLRAMSEQGSAYSIGELDGSVGGMISVFPQAVIVSLYRPFLWETRNPIMLLAALEATFFIWVTFRAITKAGIFRFINTLRTEHLALVGLVFTIPFCFGVGTSSGNFGTLVRYKIPMMPFYLASMLIVLESYRLKRPIRKNRKGKLRKGDNLRNFKPVGV